MSRNLILTIVFFTLAVAGVTAGGTWALFSETTSVGGNTFTAKFVSLKVGNFTKSTGGAPASQAVTGVGFQPKAVIFYWTRQTATGFATIQRMGFGFATGASNERAVAVAESFDLDPTESGRRVSETKAIIILSNGVPTRTAEAEVTSFNADGFTINWTTNEARADIIHYIAIGGDGLTNALASTFTLGTAAGNQAVTGVGFQPDVVWFLSSFTAANDTNTADSLLSLGLAVSATKEGAQALGTNDNQSSTTVQKSQQRTDASILVLNASVAQDAIADFVSMNADGFTVNKSDAPAATVPIFYLALKGGWHDVGSFAQPAATGNQAKTGVGFRPGALMLLSTNHVAGSGIVAETKVSIGAATSSSVRGGIWSDSDNVNPSNTNSYTSTTDVITLASSTSTVNARADFVSFDDDGFTLNWSAADATAREVLYWAMR